MNGNKKKRKLIRVSKKGRVVNLDITRKNLRVLLNFNNIPYNPFYGILPYGLLRLGFVTDIYIGLNNKMETPGNFKFILIWFSDCSSPVRFSSVQLPYSFFRKLGSRDGY